MLEVAHKVSPNGSQTCEGKELEAQILKFKLK